MAHRASPPETPPSKRWTTEGRSDVCTAVSRPPARPGSAMGRLARELVLWRISRQEQALLDAVDAARDAMQAGYEAQVWIKVGSALARVL